MELERISLTIDRDLMRRFDALLARTGHTNRSEAIRDLIRARLVEETWTAEDTDAVASITMVYDHEKRELADKLTETGHAHHEQILASMHVHLDRRHCLEVIALRGAPAELRHLADHMIGMKGVKHGQLAMTSAKFEKPDGK